MTKRLTTRLLCAVMGCVMMTGCTQEIFGVDWETLKQSVQETTAPPTEAVTDESDTEETDSESAAVPVSPLETVTARLGYQVDVDLLLNRDSPDDAGKNAQVSLEHLMQPGDLVSSFTFVFYANDGKSNIREFKGGCGISVTPDCPVSTSEGWYQSEEFIQPVNGSYAEITWEVPADVAPYIDPAGIVQVGYWWGDYAYLELKNVICTSTRTQELPVDSTQTVSVRKTLNYSNDATKSVTVPLGDVLGEGNVPQAITFDLTGQGSFRKFTGAFGISSGEEMFMSDTVAVLTDANSLTLTWILPEEAAYSIPENPEVMLGYWWSEAGDITLNSITVKYSSSESQRPEISDRPAAASQEGGDSVNTDNRAAELAADIRIGWNLGNTLDCYDKENKPVDETYWGNIRTTKAMFDAVKAKGFNAVRIPVSWTNHLRDDNTIDPAWLDRVQEVVDYAMQDDLYVILNMHHDDYTWLHPVYAEEKAVSAKYVRIWTQIAERFKNYNTKLLFEGMNEPRMVGSANEWTGGTDEERDVINHLLKIFVSTIRASGGNNANRTLVVTTHAASITDAAVNGLVLPEDSNLIVSIHNYAPWKFTTKEYPNERTFDDNGKAELNRQFGMLHAKFISRGIPVIIGEFGAENKGNDANRIDYYSYYVETARSYGIPCFIWDNGLADSYGLLDRSSNNWSNIADAALK